MKNLELITADNAERINEIGEELAQTYKIAFAGPPWNEVSRCNNTACTVGFELADVGCACSVCGSTLADAYDSAELVQNWNTILNNENALFEVTYEDGSPQRATIVRPTNMTELYTRKYSDIPAMKPWLQKRFTNDFVWIEDTFANRERKATGNLCDRGESLRRIAGYYGGALILTRTLSPAIVSSTLRDAKSSTSVFIGENRVGEAIVNKAFKNPGYELPSVPDRRTLLVVNNALRAN